MATWRRRRPFGKIGKRFYSPCLRNLRRSFRSDNTSKRKKRFFSRLALTAARGARTCSMNVADVSPRVMTARVKTCTSVTRAINTGGTTEKAGPRRNRQRNKRLWARLAYTAVQDARKFSMGHAHQCRSVLTARVKMSSSVTRAVNTGGAGAKAGPRKLRNRQRNKRLWARFAYTAVQDARKFSTNVADQCRSVLTARVKMSSSVTRALHTGGAGAKAGPRKLRNHVETLSHYILNCNDISLYKNSQCTMVAPRSHDRMIAHHFPHTIFLLIQHTQRRRQFARRGHDAFAR